MHGQQNIKICRSCLWGWSGPRRMHGTLMCVTSHECRSCANCTFKLKAAFALLEGFGEEQVLAQWRTTLPTGSAGHYPKVVVPCRISGCSLYLCSYMDWKNCLISLLVLEHFSVSVFGRKPRGKRAGTCMVVWLQI